MTPPTGTALLILVAFVLPGFVTLLISERTNVLRDTTSAFDRTLLALYYSVLTYLILGGAAWIFGFDRDDVRRLYRTRARATSPSVLAILVIPAALATVGRVWFRPRPRAGSSTGCGST